MKVILHVGGAKTGSSTIQDFCFVNQRLLQEKQVYYPQGRWNQYLELQPMYAKGIDNVQYYFNSFIDEAEKANCSTLLLSAEGTQPIVPLLKCSPNVSLAIIQYFRLFPSFNESLLSELVKSTFPLSSRGFNIPRVVFYQGIDLQMGLRSRFIHYNCESWCKNGSAGEIFWTRQMSQHCLVHSFSFEKALSEGLIKHFCQQIGINNLEGFSCPTYNVNVTPCTAALFFVSQCNCLPLSQKVRLDLLDYIEHNTVIHDKSKYLLVAPEMYRKWMDDERDVMNEMATLVGDPHWVEKCYEWLEGKEVVPYDNLPVHLQHEIFNNLPQHFQEAILNAWPIARLAQSHEAILPPFPNSLEAQVCLQSWHDAYLLQANLLEQKERDAEQLCNDISVIQERVRSAEEELGENALLRNKSAHLQAEIDALRSSLSWRLTASMRRLGAFFKKLKVK